MDVNELNIPIKLFDTELKLRQHLKDQLKYGPSCIDSIITQYEGIVWSKAVNNQIVLYENMLEFIFEA